MSQASDASGQPGLAGQASEKVQDAAAVAQEKASELREQGTSRLRDQLDQRSTDAGSQVRSVAEALRRGSSDLQNEGNTSGAQLAGQAADRFDRFGSYLEQKSGDEFMRDIETFARRRPWMLAGLGMLAGIAAARFLKASSEQRYGGYPRPTDRKPTQAPSTGWSGNGGEGRPALARGGDWEPNAASASGGSAALGDDALARDPYARTR
jgi:hypothetical protein